MNKQARPSQPLDQAGRAPCHVPAEACRAEIIPGASAAPRFPDRGYDTGSAEPGFRW